MYGREGYHHVLHEVEQADSEGWAADPGFSEQRSNEKGRRVVEGGRADRDEELEGDTQGNRKPAFAKRLRTEESAGDVLKEQGRPHCIGEPIEDDGIEAVEQARDSAAYEDGLRRSGAEGFRECFRMHGFSI